MVCRAVFGVMIGLLAGCARAKTWLGHVENPPPPMQATAPAPLTPPSDFATNIPCPAPVPPAPPPLPGPKPAEPIVAVAGVEPAESEPPFDIVKHFGGKAENVNDTSVAMRRRPRPSAPNPPPQSMVDEATKTYLPPNLPPNIAPPASPPAPSPSAPRTPTPPAKPAEPVSDAAAARKLLDAFAKQYAGLKDFEARLVKREVVNGKALPQDEILYRFRVQPQSVYMKVLSENGQGREVLYVRGQFQNQMHVVTGKGDNRLVGVGFKTTVDPDSRQATAKSRYRIYEAGFSRTLAGLTKSVEAMEKNQPGVRVKVLGPVKRPEYPYPLECVEGTIQPGDEPGLPKGGTRRVFFDSKPESPSYMLPVLVVTTEPDGREVEYYCFDRFKIPSGMTDADWTPDHLGGKRK